MRCAIAGTLSFTTAAGPRDRRKLGGAALHLYRIVLAGPLLSLRGLSEPVPECRIAALLGDPLRSVMWALTYGVAITRWGGRAPGTLSSGSKV